MIPLLILDFSMAVGVYKIRNSMFYLFINLLIVREAMAKDLSRNDADTIRLDAPEGKFRQRFPDIGDLASRLRFAPSEGQIWFDNRRMMLVQTAAMASLKRELIETVGAEKARGLLTRMGYLSGTRDAETVRRVRPDIDSFDAFAVGPQLHALEGIVAVETVHMDFDVTTGNFHGEFIWRNSTEAEEHMAVYGLGHEPVCWMQQGYASGYVSAYMGRQILIREVECRAMGHPCCRIVAKPIEEWEDAEEEVRYLKAQTFVQSPVPADGDVANLGSGFDLVGVSAGFNAVCHMIQRVAPTRATVLFLGESGVGKEQFARTLHRVSKRKDAPFVAVNCAAIPDNLIESELFGVERGGFSGAVQSRPGRFERADGGTLFLDEIGTLSHAAQGKLLRALQEGEVERIGDTRTRQVDVRVVAATNENLKDLVAAGTFREDLYYRLNVFPVFIPPLRERREDILLLTEYFFHRYRNLHERKVTGLTERAIESLQAYDWPGNVRELENIIERGVILALDDGPVDLPHLFTSGERVKERQFKLGQGGGLRAASLADAGVSPLSDPGQLSVLVRNALENRLVTLDTMEALLVNTANEMAGGNVVAAAKLLGTTRARVAYRLGGRGKGRG